MVTAARCATRRLSHLCPSRQTACQRGEDAPMDGDERQPVEQSPNTGRVEIRSDGDGCATRRIRHRLELEHGGSRHAHLSKQREPASWFYCDDAPPINDVADVNVGRMPPSATHTRPSDQAVEQGPQSP